MVKYAEKIEFSLKIEFLGADVPLALIPPPSYVTFCHKFLYPLLP